MVLHSSDIQYAESRGGFNIRLYGVKVADIWNVGRNQKIEISLDVDMIDWARLNEDFTFELKANTTDGVRILSKNSGKGAKLIFRY